MRSIYSSPLRVYLILGVLALVGIYSGTQLPISLYPNSSKPTFWVGFSYEGMTAEEFLHTYGTELEGQLQNLKTEDVSVDYIEAKYRGDEVSYLVAFDWGGAPITAERELRNTMNSFSSRLPSDIRDSMFFWVSNDNTGFFAASFYSDQRDLNEVYDIVEPLLSPKIAEIQDAADPEIFNPSQQEIRIELKPEAMASLQIVPRTIEAAILPYLDGRTGGAITVGTNHMMIQMPRQISAIDDLNNVPIPTASGKTVHLSDIAMVDFGPATTGNRSFKTSGASSLILYSIPKPGGNIKRMSEDFIKAIEEIRPSFPPDVQYKVLVDPSEFIRASVKNVLHEVFLAAGIAVIILFLFIGSVRNVITAAIEIPLSMVLAFILMRFFNMNLNLISLGGLALSAGMNVDASVVVMENIFRHFEKYRGKALTYAQRLNIIITAVNEVKLAVIAATIASLVVFVPLAFTSDLTYAILGDLAKAVVFSHGFSAFVAIILVPTIRLQLMARGEERPHKSPINGLLVKVEEGYAKSLQFLLERRWLKMGSYFGFLGILVLMLLFVLPKLRKEIVGTPDTDWVTVAMNTSGNSRIKEMEAITEEIERGFLEKFGEDINYTFTQVRGANRSRIMARLHNKKDMQRVVEALEKEYVNSPDMRYRVRPWNPSELPIPDPEHLRINLNAKPNNEARVHAAIALDELFEGKKLYPRVWTDPNVYPEHAILLKPHSDQWSKIREARMNLTPADLSDIAEVATNGKRAGRMPVEGRLTNITFRFPAQNMNTVEQIAALPVGIDSKIVPLKALASVEIAGVPPSFYRENMQDLVVVQARLNAGEEHLIDSKLAEAKALVNDWKKEWEEKNPNSGVTIAFADSFEELTEALEQLSFAVAISILLIFLTLIFQFGSLAPTLIVLVSVPLGFIGVLTALFVFNSTLSLNSALGVILLNGIAVANSIILVDFMMRLHRDGVPAREAALQAARKRLRPILITSLTTILGMFPIALGLGDGGKILQPLGITVSAGLWVSTVLTLFLVPALQETYLDWVERRRAKQAIAAELTPEPSL